MHSMAKIMWFATGLPEKVWLQRFWIISFKYSVYLDLNFDFHIFHIFYSGNFSCYSNISVLYPKNFCFASVMLMFLVSKIVPSFKNHLNICKWLEGWDMWATAHLNKAALSHKYQEKFKWIAETVEEDKGESECDFGDLLLHDHIIWLNVSSALNSEIAHFKRELRVFITTKLVLQGTLLARLGMLLLL